MDDVLLDNDNDYVGDDRDYSEGSDVEFGVRKKKKHVKNTPKNKPKSKRSKKVKTKPPERRGSRRSSRTTSAPSYCEESENSDDMYELCDGQPKVKKEIPAPKVILKEPVPTRNRTKKKAKKVTTLKSASTYYDETVSPELVNTNLTPTSRTSSRKRSQVSYVEDSSDDELDSYELCDGQPVKRHSTTTSVDMVGSTLPKRKRVKVEESTALDEDRENEPKVVLVQGQPILKVKALSMLEENNQFYVEKSTMNLTEVVKPLHIWKLHEKVLEKFEQIEFSKVWY